MSFPVYGSYSDSGITRLGSLPSHWGTAPIKAVASGNDEVLTEATDPDYELDYVEISDVQAGVGITGSTIYAFSEAPSRARRKVRDGDILVSTVRTYLRAISQVHAPPENMIVSTGFAVLRPRNVDPSFLGYAVEAEATIHEIVARSAGVSYPAINASELVRIEIPTPPLVEQTAIATFLDRETAKIDALVEEQRRLIALLKEKCQAVISHAVTKGLDPTVPMKDSGEEWLGDVPAHWDVTAIKHHCELLTDGTHQPPQRVVEGVPLLSVRNIQDNRFNFLDDDSRISESDYLELCRSFVPKPGDVLLAIVGATLGKSALIPEDMGQFHIQRSLAIFRTQANTLSAWLCWIFRSTEFQKLLWNNVGYSAQPGIYLGTLADFKIPVPTPGEQFAILKELKPALSALDEMAATASKGIKLLLERRGALISAVVTGKIDVRAATPAAREDCITSVNADGGRHANL